MRSKSAWIHLSFVIILIGCQWEKEWLRPDQSNDQISAPTQDPNQIPACSNLVQECLRLGQKNIWRDCIISRAKGQIVQDVQFSQQEASICWEAGRALYGKRYWFNGIDFSKKRTN